MKIIKKWGNMRNIIIIYHHISSYIIIYHHISSYIIIIYIYIYMNIKIYMKKRDVFHRLQADHPNHGTHSGECP